MVKQQQCIWFISFILLLMMMIMMSVAEEGAAAGGGVGGGLVRKEERKEIIVTEYGTISAVKLNDGSPYNYHLRFITLDPNSLFLPVLLHSDMVFYVQTGSGSLSWVGDGDMNHMDVKRGDVYRIRSGSIFFVRSSLDAEREKLRVNAIFTNGYNFEYSQQLYTEPYSSVSNLITGFDTKILQAAFQASEEVVDNVTRSSKPPPIVHVASENKTDGIDWTERIFNVLVGGDLHNLNKKKKKKSKAFNFIDAKPDFKNCNGWSKTVNRKDLKALKGSNLGAFMVNLTQASMMSPHWNPRATEITMVVHGEGMVRVVCSNMGNTSECKNRRFRVQEGDVFAVPKFHPMAQMAYNNDTFVFMGFSTMAKSNYPQFLAGKSSVLRTLDRDILAMSFNVPNATIDELVAAQDDSIILECLSCAEEEERRMEEEKEKERREEERKREEEAAAEEEAARKREEEEEARKRAEEAARKKEEEEARKKEEEEARKRAEEAARKREEEEEARKRAEEEARKKEDEEARKRAEEEARKKEDEEARKRAEEAAREREEEEEARKRAEEEASKKEEEEARKRAEEEARKREEEEAAAEREGKRRQEEEEARRQEEERKAKEEEQQKEEERRQEEEEERRAKEEEQQKEEQEARRQEKEIEEAQARQEEERRRQEEAAAKRQEKKREEAQRRQEEKREERRRKEEEEARRQEEEREREESRGGGGGGGGSGRWQW